MTLTTVETIKKAALKRGWKIDETECTGYIGVRYFEGMWAWYQIDLLLGRASDAIFDHTYSQNTGVTDKSYKKGRRITDLIEKAAEQKATKNQAA